MTEVDVECALQKLNADDRDKARSVLDTIDAVTNMQRRARGLPPISPVGCIPDIEFLPPVVYGRREQ
jgi:hypothetical protein